VNWRMREIRTAVAEWFTHRDRIKPSEIQRVYGWGVDIAGRELKQANNLDAHKVNSSVNICIRAITDAVASLKWELVALQNVGGIEREEADEEHPANAMLQNPNPDMTLREVIRHITKSLLGDGNALLTIERMTGPNDAIELWPRDPRPPYVEPYIPSGVLKGYYFGFDQRSRVFYRKDQVVHIRDISPESPIWGVPRFEAVRTEIYMDYLVNEFNKNFFINGAALGLMWNPAVKLTEQQHQQMIAGFEAVQRGTPNAFKTLFNMYPGQWSTPDQKHRDIAFGDLLRMNREKIYGAFGLPPFRGGVMEYANYANALAQDKDFWNNTVKPITTIIEDALNKQVIWRFWDRDIKLRCCYDDVPALKGEPLEQMQVDALAISSGIFTVNEVRERRNLKPLKEEPKQLPPSEDNPDDVPADEEAPIPSKEEEEDVSNALGSIFRQERHRLRTGLNDYTASGRFMSRLVWAEGDAQVLLPVTALYERLASAVVPVVINIGRQHTNATFKQSRSNTYHIPTEQELVAIKESAQGELLNLAMEMHELLQSFLADAMAYDWHLPDLIKRTNGIFSQERIEHTTQRLLTFTIRQADALAVAESLGITNTGKRNR
jgi:HK97 family phage portal protein